MIIVTLEKIFYAFKFVFKSFCRDPELYSVCKRMRFCMKFYVNIYACAFSISLRFKKLQVWMKRLTSSCYRKFDAWTCKHYNSICYYDTRKVILQFSHNFSWKKKLIIAPDIQNPSRPKSTCFEFESRK